MFGFFGAFGHDLGKIGNGREFLEQRLQQGQPICTNLFVFHHDHNFVEKFVYRLAGGRENEQSLFVFFFLPVRFNFRGILLEVRS